ncbi:2-isopropylmalate synthase [bacterium]|nr:2-isopropylmalate synthase [bacterium]
MPKQILILDTTLRDGEQAPGFSMTVDQKVRFARQLDRLGVDVIEAGFPIASQGDFEAVRQIAGIVSQSIVAGLCRTRRGDIDRAWEALQHAARSRIHTFIATSDIHLEHKLKLSRKAALKEAVKGVSYAASLTADVEFSAEDAVRTDIDYLCEVVQAVIEAGATTVNIPDTVGYAIPLEFGEFIAQIVDKVPNINQAVISVHCHNDLGLAVANSISAVQNGAGQVECTVNGIGERAGNAALEEVVMALKVRRDFLDYELGVKSEEIARSSRLLTRITSQPVQRNKAIVGENAFAHEAGIHQHGMMQNSSTYEIMTPESVGVAKSMLVLGKHSGRHALAERYRDLGYDLNRDELNRIYSAFTDLADKKKTVYDADLLALVESGQGSVEAVYTLENLQVASGTGVTPTATVRIVFNGDIFEDSAVGDGPVDAAFKAVERATGVSVKLEAYHIDSVSAGKDAQGEVLLRIEAGGRSFAGRAASTDVVEASVRAYIQALNRAASSGVVINKERDNDDTVGTLVDAVSPVEEVDYEFH